MRIEALTTQVIVNQETGSYCASDGKNFSIESPSLNDVIGSLGDVIGCAVEQGYLGKEDIRTIGLQYAAANQEFK